MSPVSATPCPQCGEPVLYDPDSLARQAGCGACGKVVRLTETSPVAGPGQMNFTVNGRPVSLAGFRPSPLAVVAIVLAVATGVALAVVFAALALGLVLAAAALMLAAAVVGRVGRALSRGRGGNDTRLRLPVIVVGLLFAVGCSDRDPARKELAAAQADAAAEKQNAEVERRVKEELAKRDSAPKKVAIAPQPDPPARIYTFEEAWAEAKEISTKINSQEPAKTEEAFNRLGKLDQGAARALHMNAREMYPHCIVDPETETAR
ncbi:zinc ribbon domain-containing protein [Limnoglobus roseus]|uniref:Uncharacterized protein n=1 Tax=Limnoglobus roseus TaxID=2598579 RepID=A0A5C1AE76_9BACT|nr:zinc ribbon domain-containing protein [Limnoglobus roseus]QEL17541.1 hypothetical protein PX52LOC_04531 [Limnoglobus roseus]